MKKFQLSIPTPCHENWDAMTPAEKGRFCGACQKTVIDFSNMSDREVAQYFKKPSGNLCGRFHPDQLDRTIDVPTKRLPWLKYFFNITLPAFLLSLKANAQRENMIGKVAFVNSRSLIDSTVSTEKPIVKPSPTKGRIAIKKPSRFKVQEIKTDSSLFPMAPICIQPKLIPDEDRNSIATSFQGFLGGVIYVAPVRTKKKETPKLMPPKQKEAGIVHFMVYPNPVTANAPLAIQSGYLESGSYELRIITSTGAIVQKGEVLIDKEAKSMFNLTTVPAGPYFVQLTNRKSNKSYTEIIIVQ